MTWILAVAAVATAAAAGLALARRGTWDPALHRMVLVVLLLPWAVQQASLARLARSPSLNPLRRSLEEGALLQADWVAPLILGVALTACLVAPRRLRALAVLLPLVGSALLWWVSVPLYARSMMRGWFWVTEGLAGPWPFVYALAATAFLAGWALPGPVEAEAPRGA